MALSESICVDGKRSANHSVDLRRDVCRPLIWAEYMNMNVESLTPEEMRAMDFDGQEASSEVVQAGQEEDDLLVRTNSETSASTDVSQAIKAKYAEKREDNEVKEWPWLDLEKDPVMAGSSAARFFGGKSLKIRRPHEDVTAWDLRARMEKKERMKKEHAAWVAEKESTIGRYTFQASDWRTDVRVKDTGDPNDPEYREWTMKEIWDLIVLGGRTADPRDVPHKVMQPGSRTDFVAEGFVQQPEIPDWLAMHGKLIDEEQQGDIVDPTAESVLLASEFSDFDEDFNVGTESMDDGSF